MFIHFQYPCLSLPDGKVIANVATACDPGKTFMRPSLHKDCRELVHVPNRRFAVEKGSDLRKGEPL